MNVKLECNIECQFEFGIRREQVEAIGIMFSSMIVVAFSLIPSVFTQIVIQPGYTQPNYGYQVPQTYMPMQYPVPYNPYHRSSVASEYQRYQDLNRLIQQQITGIMQNDPNQLQSVDTIVGSIYRPHSPFLRPHMVRPYFSGGRLYSVTPHGLRGLNHNTYGIYNQPLLRSPNPEESRPNIVRCQSTRSIQQSNGTTSGNNSTITSHVTDVVDVAKNTTITPTDFSKVESLNESEDKPLEPRSIRTDNFPEIPIYPYEIQLNNDQNQSIATVNWNLIPSNNPIESSSNGSSPEQIFSQIRPDFSHMELYNKGQDNSNVNNEIQGDILGDGQMVADMRAHNHRGLPAAHPSYAESAESAGGNWLTDRFHNYMNKARNFISPGYGYPGYSGYAPHNPYATYPMAPMVHPSTPTYQPGPVPPYGGYRPYGGPAGSSAMSSATSSASSNYNNPFGYRSLMNFGGRGLTYQSSDWANLNNPMRSQPPRYPGWFI